jgi:hypothetical protein
MASGFALAGVGLAVAAGLLFTPASSDPELGLAPTAIVGSFVPTPCSLPHDAALGNAGGDPYAFYVFNREEELAGLRESGCGSVVAATTMGVQLPALTGREASDRASGRDAALLNLASD